MQQQGPEPVVRREHGDVIHTAAARQTPVRPAGAQRESGAECKLGDHVELDPPIVRRVVREKEPVR
jgi:hypothetical protein